MKKFKIKHGKKTYLVKAADKDSAMDKLVEKGFIEKLDDKSPEEKAQEWVDYDLKHYGHVSEETKSDIKKMGLDFDKWDNQVKDDGGIAAYIAYMDMANKKHNYYSVKEYAEKVLERIEKSNLLSISDCDVKPISDCDMSNIEVKDAANFSKYQYVDACKYIDDAWYKITDNVADGILQSIGLTNRVFDAAWTKLKNLIDNDNKLSDADKAELERYF